MQDESVSRRYWPEHRAIYQQRKFIWIEAFCEDKFNASAMAFYETIGLRTRSRQLKYEIDEERNDNDEA